MKATKILAGMSAAAFAASLLTMVSSAADDGFVKTDITSAVYGLTVKEGETGTFTVQHVDTWDNLSVEISEGEANYNVIDPDAGVSYTGLRNLGFIDNGETGNLTSVDVNSLTINGYEFTSDVVKKTLDFSTSSSNGLPNIWNWADMVGTGEVITSDDGNAYLEMTDKDGIYLYVNPDAESSSTEDTSSEAETETSYEVPADMITGNAVNLYSTDEEGNTTGVFSTMEEALSYNKVVFTITADEAEIQKGIEAGTWMAGGVGTNDGLDGGWKQNEWAFQAGAKPIDIVKVEDGVYTITLELNADTSSLDATDTFAQVWFQDWTKDATLNMTVTGVTLYAEAAASDDSSATEDSATDSTTDSTGDDSSTTDEPTVPTVTEDFEVSLDYMKDNANHQVFLMGDESKGEAGPFNGKADELAQYAGFTYIVTMDEDVLAEALAPVYDEETGDLVYNEDGTVATASWINGGLGANSESTEWAELCKWSIYLDENGEVAYNNVEKLEDGVYAITFTTEDGSGIFANTDTYAQLWMADWSGIKPVTGVTGVTLLAPDQEYITVTCPCGCDCTEDTCDVWDAELGQCGCGCCNPAEFVAFEMFADSTWIGWGNWSATTIPNKDGVFGNGTDAVITADETSYEVSISAEQVAAWYNEAGQSVEAGTEGATAVSAKGVEVWNVDIVGLADAIGAGTDGVKFVDEDGAEIEKSDADALNAAKMQLAKDAGLEISNVVVSVDGEEVAIPDDKLLYGDIEGNGNIRIEIFNPGGKGATANEETRFFVEEMGQLATDLEATDTISVSFDITSGIPASQECTCDVCNDDEPTNSDESTGDDSTSSTESTTSSTTSSAASGSAGKTDTNPSTGAAALGVVGVLLAGAAMVVSKKND